MFLREPSLLTPLSFFQFAGSIAGVPTNSRFYVNSVKFSRLPYIVNLKVPVLHLGHKSEESKDRLTFVPQISHTG